MRNFTPDQFVGSGQYVIREYDQNVPVRATFISTILYKVGYSINPHNEGRICLISMSDGWVIDGSVVKENGVSVMKPFKILQQLCDDLNNPERQEYRFATDDEILIAIMASIKNRQNNVFKSLTT